MENDIRRRYRRARAGLADGSAVTVLHIGEAQTAVATGTGNEAGDVLVLSIGSKTTAADFFKHMPPLPGELENAIMLVEDELSRLRRVMVAGSALVTTDAAIREIALVSGVAMQPELILTLDAVERSFESLAALSLGRPASSAGIPADAAFAATLLILREFMHHLQFSSISVMRRDDHGAVA